MQIAPTPRTRNTLKWILTGSVITLILAWTLLHYSVLAPTLKIKTVNFPAEQSQLFFKKDSSYSEKNSLISKINKETNTFEFTLPFYNESIRWDPLEAAGEFSIESISIGILGFKSLIDIENATPLNQIEKKLNNGTAHFTVTKDSTDPQIQINLNQSHLKYLRLSIALALSAAIALTIVSLLAFRLPIFNLIFNNQRIIDSIKVSLENDKTKTLGMMVERRKNNFDLIRLAAALTVLATHSFPLTGTTSTIWYGLFLGYEPGSLAVYAFFAISGFLIAGSLERRSLLEYWQARALRIVPALAVTVFVTALIIGPIFTNLSLREYFHHSGTYNYLTNSVPYQTHFMLPGVFTTVPFAQSVNGSLWTIPIEAFCYVALAVIFVVGSRTFNLVIPAIFIISALLVWNFLHQPMPATILFGSSELLPVMRFGLIFLVGTALWKFKDIVPFKGGIAATCFAILLLGSKFDCKSLALFIALPYLLFYLAYRITVFENAMHKLGDLSYGTYLFAFPIQQSLVSLSNNSINPWLLTIITATISLGLAWYSWRFIEKPAIKLKNRFQPSKGLQRSVN